MKKGRTAGPSTATRSGLVGSALPRREPPPRRRLAPVYSAGLAVMAARVFSLVAAAAQLPLLTRMLEPAEYSLIALAIAVSTYFSLATAEPIILPFQRFPGNPVDRLNYSYALTRTVLTILVAVPILLGITSALGQWHLGIAIAGWGTGIATTRLVSTAWLTWERPWRYAVNLMASTGARTVGLVWLVSAGAGGSLSIAIAGAATAAAAVLLGPRLELKGITTVARPWSLLFGVRLAVASAAFTVLTTAHFVMLPWFAGDTDVGRYAAMDQIATLTGGAAAGLLLTVAYPPLRRRWEDGEHAAVKDRLDWLRRICLSIGLACCALLLLADYAVLRAAVGQEYLNGAVIAPLTIAATLAAMGQLSSWEHQLSLRAARLARRTVLSAACGVVFSAGLGYLYGPTGAAIGAGSGFLVYFLAMCAGASSSAVSVAGAIAALAFAILTALGTLATPIAASLAALGSVLAVSTTLRRPHARTA